LNLTVEVGSFLEVVSENVIGFGRYGRKVKKIFLHDLIVVWLLRSRFSIPRINAGE